MGEKFTGSRKDTCCQMIGFYLTVLGYNYIYELNFTFSPQFVSDEIETTSFNCTHIQSQFLFYAVCFLFMFCLNVVKYYNEN